MDKPRILAVVGPTASGKTALSVMLAEKLNGEIVSCDSMQVYQKMDIGTAKPSEQEKKGIRHHLIDIVPPDAAFDASDYVRLAQQAVGDILSRNRLPVFCGGTGLYLDSFLRGGFCETAGDPGYRQYLEQLADKKGAPEMHDMLKKVDPMSADAIHPNNVRRVIRALEIYHATGLTKTELDRMSREKERKYDVFTVGIRFPDRNILYGRIDARVDAMMADGLLDEVKMLYDEGVFERSKTAAQAIGYKELIGVVEGNTDIDTAVDNLKRATRRYAKRQMTWFCSHGDVMWLDRDGNTDLQVLADRAADAFEALEKR